MEGLQKTTETVVRFDWSLGREWNSAPSKDNAGMLSHDVWLKCHLVGKVILKYRH
jgi:hypothetical protein